MISKKLAAALGAGALGAAGAGTLGAKLFDKGKIKLSESDKKAIELAEKWESRSSNHGLVIIEVKEGKTITWKCTLTPILLGYGQGSGSIGTLGQWQELEKEIKKDENKRRKFVENCSGSRTSGEKTKGEASTIELETIKDNNIWKFKDFGKILTEDFKGLRRLEGDDDKAFKSKNWEINEEGEKKEKTKKITVSTTVSSNKKWSCSISGTYEGELTSKTFKKKELEDILKVDSQDVGKSEKRKYLIRNCLKHNKEITRLTVQTEGSDGWKFSDLVKITEGMYENPTET